MKRPLPQNNIAHLVAERHSKHQTVRVVRDVGSDQDKFDSLMKVFLSSNGELARRAAWALGFIVIENPFLVHKWLSKILSNLSKQEHHPAIYRNTFRFLEVIEIPEKHAAAVLDSAYSFILNRSHPAAVRAFAIGAALNVVRKHPELANELKAVINEVKDEEIPAIRSRSRKVMRHLSKIGILI